MTGIAFVGCAHIHTPKFAAMVGDRDDIDVVGVWDHDLERATRTANGLGSLSVADLSTIWADDGIEAVVICSESVHHPDLVSQAVDARKHLFVEKPLAISGAQARRLAAMIEASGLTYSTGFFMRGRGVYRYLREQISQRTFGKLVHIDTSVAHAGALSGWFDGEWRWLTDPDQAGYGGFGDLGIHAVDLVLWLLGYRSRPDAVAAWTGAATGRYGSIDEFGHGQLTFSDGLVASIWASWADLGNPVELVVSGTRAHAALTDGRLTIRRLDTQMAELIDSSDLAPDLPHAFELFLDAITGDRTAPLVAPAEAASCSTLIEALYRAAGEVATVGASPQSG